MYLTKLAHDLLIHSTGTLSAQLAVAFYAFNTLQLNKKSQFSHFLKFRGLVNAGSADVFHRDLLFTFENFVKDFASFGALASDAGTTLTHWNRRRRRFVFFGLYTRTEPLCVGHSVTLCSWGAHAE